MSSQLYGVCLPDDDWPTYVISAYLHYFFLPLRYTLNNIVYAYQYDVCPTLCLHTGTVAVLRLCSFMYDRLLNCIMVHICLMSSFLQDVCSIISVCLLVCCLPHGVMSAQWCNVCPPVWYLFYVMILPICMMSCFLYDVSSMVWCLPAWMMSVRLYDVLSYFIDSNRLYDVCSTV